jgi:azobenzene reductase
MKVLLLCGSISKKSHTLALLRYCEELLQAAGAETVLWDLAKQPLPIALPEYHRDPSLNPDKTVQKFVATVNEVDLVVLGTPLYHGSFSGILKNALDNLKGNAFKGKWIGLAGNTSGVRADMVAFSQLRHVVNTMVGYTIQTQLKSCEDDYDETPTAYVLREESIQKRAKRFVEELVEKK